MSKHHLFNEIDKTAALIGAVFALVLTVYLALTIRRPIYTTVGVLLLLAFVAYLVIRKSLSSFTLPSLASMEISNTLRHILNIVFFILFLFSIASVYLRPELYSRPLAYFISTAFMVSVVAVEILFLPSSRFSNCLTLFKIALIGLSLEFSQLLIFPSIVGIDPWWDQGFTLKILFLGHIPVGTGYSTLPVMYLITGSTSLLTGLDYKTATMLSVSLAQVLCSTLFTFILGNRLLNNKVGLLGSLLLVTADWHINLGYWAIPTTMASIFVLPIVYLLIKAQREHSFPSVLLAMLLMSVSIITHTITALFIAILLLTAWLVPKIRTPLHEKREIPVAFPIFLLYTVGMLLLWTYASGDITTSPAYVLAGLIKVGFSAARFAGSAPTDVMRYASSLPFPEQALNNLGIFIFFAISLIGCLYMISRKFGNYYTSIVAIGGIVPLSLAFFTQIAGKSIIQQRWWYYSEILLALPVAIALFLLCLSVRSKLGRSLLLMGLTFSLSLFMILSPQANFDNPVISPNSTVRFALTESELQAIEMVNTTWSGKIGTDTYYYKCMVGAQVPPTAAPLNSTKDISDQIYSGNFSVARAQNMYVLIRTEIMIHPFRYGTYTYRLEYDPEQALGAQLFSRVYDCGSVSGFVK